MDVETEKWNHDHVHGLSTVLAFLRASWSRPSWRAVTASSRTTAHDHDFSESTNSTSPNSIPFQKLSMDNPRKRTRSHSPPPWRREQNQRPRGGGPDRGDSHNDHRYDRNMKEQSRLNALQEAEQARAWVSQEDTFVLQQAKKKAEIRVKEGRAKPIDFLAVNLRVIDPQRPNPLEDEIPDEDLDIVDPEGILDGLDEGELEELAGDIETYIGLETNKTNGEFWRVCLSWGWTL